MNNLNIGKAIKAMLSANAELTTKVGTSIFPIVAQYDAKFPFITYQRRSVSPHYVKDGIVNETVSVDLCIAANSYSESIEIANLVRRAVELKTGNYGGIYVRMAHLNGAQETFYDGVYIQQLNFLIIL